MPHKICVSLIPGDGIGPEIIESVVRIFEKASVPIVWEYCTAGAQVFQKGIPSGIPVETIESIKKNRVALKGPLETPVGFGEKSANVTLRKVFGTFANVRPVQLLPNIPSRFKDASINFVVLRENLEDLYTGMEYYLTPTVTEGSKLITLKGCTKIIRFAFEYARQNKRKKVHCATKANIMKFSEGLFKKTFENIAQEYPDIAAEHIIIDNCAHLMVLHPELFDVVVTSNLNGDILSDLASGLIGGLGFSPSANIGENIAIFEAVHGSAPTIAGKDIANPTALLLSSIMMLRHMNLSSYAEIIEHGLLRALALGKMTPDVASSREDTIGTQEFTKRIIEYLPSPPTSYISIPRSPPMNPCTPLVQEEYDWTPWGADVFVHVSSTPENMGKILETIAAESIFSLQLIANRGIQIYPLQKTNPECIDLWCCRFQLKHNYKEYPESGLLDLLQRISLDFSWTKVVKLFKTKTNKFTFTKAQGEN